MGIIKYQSGGGIRSLSGIGQPTTADSLALLQNTLAYKKYISNKNYTRLEDGTYEPDAQDKAYQMVLSRVNSEGNFPGAFISNNKVSSWYPISKYRINRNPNQYYQRDNLLKIIDLDAPMHLYDRRIKPHTVVDLVHKDANSDEHTTDPRIGDAINYQEYHPLQITPFNMLNREQQIKRQKIFGVNPGEPDLISPKQKKKITTHGTTLTGPTIRGNKYPKGTIVTNDPNDPRLQAYQDSLYSYNTAIGVADGIATGIAKGYYNKNIKSPYYTKEEAQKHYKDDLNFYRRALLNPVKDPSKANLDFGNVANINGDEYKYTDMFGYPVKGYVSNVTNEYSKWINELLANKGDNIAVSGMASTTREDILNQQAQLKKYKSINKSIRPTNIVFNAELPPVLAYKKPIQPVVYQPFVNRMTPKGMPTPTQPIPQMLNMPDRIELDPTKHAAYRGINVSHYTDGLGRYTAKLNLVTTPGVKGRISYQPGGKITIAQNPSNINRAKKGGIIKYQNGTIIENIKSKINPKNWGVVDYSDKGDFATAFSAARKAGEKEFMYDSKRYSTDMAGTSKQQLQLSGITNEQLQNRNFLDKRFFSNMYPRGYESDKYGNPNRSNTIKRVGRAIILNKQDPRRNALNVNDIPRMDAFRMYSGLPQQNKTFGISDYRPSKGSEDTYYYKLNDENLKDEIINNLSNITTISDYKKYFSDDEINILKEKKDKAKIKELKQRLLDEKSEDAIRVHNNYIEQSLKNNFGINIFNDLNVMGNYKVDKGVDERGEYISYYDKWDLAPLEKKPNLLGIDSDYENKRNMDYFGKPFEIYDRIYIKDYGDGQKKRMYYSDKELSTLDVNKKNFDTLALQRELSNRGYKLPKSTKEGGAFDGVFGEETKQALMDWQNQNTTFRSHKVGGIIKGNSGTKFAIAGTPTFNQHPLLPVKITQKKVLPKLNMYLAHLSVSETTNRPKVTPMRKKYAKDVLAMAKSFRLNYS